MSHKTRLASVLALSSILLACSGAEAAPDGSTPSGSNAAAPTTYTLAAGTWIDAQLIDSISSRNAQAGQAFTARVVSDVANAAGRIAIPAGSIVAGSILEVSPAPNPRSTGTLTLVVSSVTARGSVYDIEASIDSLATTQEGRGVEGVDAARVAGGAAAGAIIGSVIGGDAKGAIIGGVAGGAAGAIVSMVVRDEDVVLPAGAHLMLTLLRPLTVAAN